MKQAGSRKLRLPYLKGGKAAEGPVCSPVTTPSYAAADFFVIIKMCGKKDLSYDDARPLYSFGRFCKFAA